METEKQEVRPSSSTAIVMSIHALHLSERHEHKLQVAAAAGLCLQVVALPSVLYVQQNNP